MKAIYNGEVIAQSDDTKVVEGNHYFPKESVNFDYLKETDSHTVCPWKGTASYYTVAVNGKEAVDGAWYYPETRDMAKPIEGYLAFWKGVEVTE